MENEFMKRGYLLPKGCKDLSDVAKLMPKQEPGMVFSPALKKFVAYKPGADIWTKSAPPPLPPITRQVFISAPMTVKKLAALLEQKPFQIICDLTQFGIWAEADSVIEFNACSLVARLHGFEAIKASS
jgi:hypothetical protein